MDWNVLIGILIPFAGTTLGAAMVFFLRNEMNERLQKALLGFASGVMIAASIWSLLIPAIEMSGEQDCVAWFPATVGFLAGMGFLLILDMLTPHMYWINEELGGMKDGFKKTTMLVLAVTLHNVPEGMAVGVTFAGVMSGSALMSMAGAFVLAIGIAVQNSPGRRCFQKKSIFIWDGVRNCGTHRRVDYDCAYPTDCANFALSVSFCGRCDDLCSGGGTGAGSAVRKAYQSCNHRSGSWVYSNDDSGRGTGIAGSRLLIPIASQNFKKKLCN